ncbi:hypothetical protein DWQ65_04430 [Treponema phagedenis]|uniref:DUF2715 domain-containing protein n=1 Tax=Treponema phagedenis TaxID=162 RepID=A0A0B7GY70_TREPH|nr:DUF2715 domain-containing protein [Treponema phagedenis]QEJ98252.1 hypothetical protein FUT82_09755 [Treponema phagedenis]QEK00999.1 hypothetical protein FUT84_07430 [Treponema phagedenis]QEK03763.1 hypothetical protein FUT83_08065 [Treponema phagedenis]QEK09378.1 hypothetical protein FUT81_07980 [Treponema phagedenis]QSH99319.1 hypothetical protein DWQ65_04430 [Treponema phagedenis]
MKKILLITSALFCASLLAAEVSISVGPAFTNVYSRAKEKGETNWEAAGETLSEAGKALKEKINAGSSVKMNAPAFAVDIHGNIVYGFVQFAFPTKTWESAFEEENKKRILEKGAFIMDGQIGAGYNFFNTSPFNLYVGGGLGVNVVRTERALNFGKIGKLDFGQVKYTNTNAMMGLGANILAHYYFTKNVGIYAGLADTLYFLTLANSKKISWGKIEIKPDKNEKVKVSDVFTNSFNAKLGLSVKF